MQHIQYSILPAALSRGLQKFFPNLTKSGRCAIIIHMKCHSSKGEHHAHSLPLPASGTRPALFLCRTHLQTHHQRRKFLRRICLRGAPRCHVVLSSSVAGDSPALDAPRRKNRHLCGFTGAPCRRALLRCHVSADGSCHLQHPADRTDRRGIGMPCVRHRAKPYAEAPAGSSTELPQPVSGDGLHRHRRKGLRRGHHRGRGNENVAGGTRHRRLPHSHGGQVHGYAGESPEYRSDSR